MWLDGQKFKEIQEVGTMNIFFVIDGKVITPFTDGAILKGITRDSILAILKDKGFDVEERTITIDEVVAAYNAGTLQEVFGTGTAAVVAHVDKIAYQDKIIKLPPVDQRKVGELAKTEINGLRAGKIKDSRGWVVPVKATETVNV